MNKKEIRIFCPEYRAVEEDGQKRIYGYAAVFNKWSEDLGWFREKIAPGAFSEAIINSDTVALFNHNSDLVLGRKSNDTLRLKEDDHGLHMEVDLPDTQAANDLFKLVERGDIKQQSFGFITDTVEWKDGEKGELDERTIIKVKELFDVSPVTFPAYPDTTIAKRCRELNKSSDNTGDNSNDTIAENEDIDIELILNKYGE